MISCEEKINGKTRAEWQEMANRSGLEVHLPDETIYPESESENSEDEQPQQNEEEEENSTVSADNSSESESDNSEVATDDNSSSINSTKEQQVDEMTNSVIGAIITSKKVCKCCGSTFSPYSGYSDEGKSPTKGGSDWCTSGQTEYCSEKCYYKFINGNCD